MRAIFLSLLAPLGLMAAGSTPSVTHIGSIKSLLVSAELMARQWSPSAVLYSALGLAPANAARYQPARWEFFYGDPKTKDGVFHVVYDDGVITGRSGIKAGAQIIEQFTNGKLSAQRSSEVDWTTHDYADCRPISLPLADTTRLDKEVRAVPIVPDEEGRFRIVLLRARNDNCDGLGHLSLYLPEKPIPKGMSGKSIWIVTGPQERVFFDAGTAEPLLRRLRGPKGPDNSPGRTVQ